MVSLIVITLIKQNKWLKYKLWCAENDFNFYDCGVKQLYKQRKELGL